MKPKLSLRFPDTRFTRRGLDTVPVQCSHAVENWKSNYAASHRRRYTRDCCIGYRSLSKGSNNGPDETLVVLYLNSVFDKHLGTGKETWIADAFRTARNSSSLGFIFEETVLLVLLQGSGHNICVLSDIFHSNQPLDSRKVTLVSLKRIVNGLIQCCPVSWTSGSPDRLVFKASYPTDFLNFLNNPDGKCFIFPDIHMGPDPLSFFQDKETKELILVP